MTLRRTLTTILLAALSSPVFFLPALPQATGTRATDAGPSADIRGIVSDSTTGEKLLGVNVRIDGTQRGATSNVFGFYLVPSVSAGTWRVIASAVGYARKEFTVQVRGGEPITLDIRLSPRVIETREIVVESQAGSAISQQTVSVHIMTPRDFKSLPTTGQQDLLRSLQLLPGITSTSDASARFFVRGGAGDQNLILLDGMKIYNPFHAFGLFSVLDPDIIKSAEVYTGAFPAGYGGRLSSVINVTTRDGNLNHVAGNANINFMSGKLQLEGPVADDNAWLINARSSLFTHAIDKLIPNPAPTTFYDMFFKGTAGTSTGRVGFRGYVSGDDVRPSAQSQPDYRWRNAAFSAVVSSLQGERIYFDVIGSYTRASIERLPKDPTATPTASLLEELSVRSEFSVFGDEGGTSFGGFEFNFPSIKNTLPTVGGGTRDITDSQAELAIWYRYETTTGPWHLNLGLHSDVFLLTDGAGPLQALQPRITISYDLGASWQVRTAVGIHTQNLISVTNEDDLISLFDAWLYLPSELRPEEARHAVFAVEGNLLPSLTSSFQLYVKSYPSLTLFNSAKVFPEEPDYINGTGLAYGFEALFRYMSPLFDVQASYTWSRVDVTIDNLTYAPRYDRRHTIKTLTTVHLLPNLDASVRWEYGSGYPFTQGEGFYSRLTLSDIGSDPFPGGTVVPTRVLGVRNAERLPAYYRLDASLMYTIPLGPLKGIIGASVINMTGAKNILYYDRNTGRTEYMTPFFPTASFTLEF